MAEPADSGPLPPAPTSAALQAWRQRGAAHFDPVRFHGIEALARRAENREGPARMLIETRVLALLAAYGADFERSAGASAPPSPARRQPGPLAALVDEVARQALPPSAPGAAPASRPGPGTPPELKALRYFRGTWTRLSAERRLAQSRARLPDNAGPLNSHRLMHRALTLMQELSPAYMGHFMGYVETLQWLDQAQAHTPPAAKDMPRPKAAAKPARKSPRTRKS